MSFATAGDIAGRFGRDLTTAENDQAELLLGLGTLLVAEAVDKDSDWADTISPVPAPLRLICIEAVYRVMQNPTGAVSVQESLGAYSHSERYDTSAVVAGLALTESEERRARRAVYGTNTASARAETLANHIGYRDDEVYIDEDTISS